VDGGKMNLIIVSLIVGTSVTAAATEVEYPQISKLRHDAVDQKRAAASSCFRTGGDNLSI
jgi:hypothetical protein